MTSACPGDVHEVAARTITFPAGDGTELYGAILGSGSVGIVLANDVPHPFCEDIPPAIFLARRGYRVIAFDYRDHGNSARRAAPGRLDLDVVGAAAELRKAGSDRILLFGSYAGAEAGDSFVSVAEAHRLYAATGFGDKDLLIDHYGFPGWYLLGNGGPVDPAVLGFVGRWAGS